MIASQRNFGYEIEGLKRFVVLPIVGGVDYNLVGAQNPIVGIHQETYIQSIDFLDFAEVNLKIGVYAVEALPVAVGVVVATEATIQ